MKLRALPVLPSMQCDSDCGECCTAFFVPEADYQKLRRFVRERGITARVSSDDPYRCPFYAEGNCAVYEARPEVCRVMGHVPELSCARGYNVNVPNPADVHDAMRSRGVAIRVLHEIAEEQSPGSVNVKDIRRWICEGSPEHIARIPERS